MWFAVATFVALAGTIAVVVVATSGSPESANPFVGRSLYAYPDSSAARAASAANGTTDYAPLARLAHIPTAVWLLPEAHPTGEITEFVFGVAADAAAKSQLPVFVVYGIPSRDCGSFSAGGVASQDYPLWVSAIAAGLAGSTSIIILEPDAIALSPSCGTQEATATFLREAIRRLSVNPGTTIYLDGGHSNWLKPGEMAPLLTAAGVGSVRGFATNVSNYNTTQGERDYAQTLSELLGGAHFVIDTSRNGNGATGDFCNPPGRALGATPSAIDDGTSQDASLWIKNPGESDGDCNGGPPAGQWWLSQALELVRGED